MSTIQMQKRHKDREQYFLEQWNVSKNFILPYIQAAVNCTKETVVAEIGCGEGGNLRPFLDLGCRVIGIDLAKNKIDNAVSFYNSHPLKENLTFIVDDVFKVEKSSCLQPDLIIMRDTLEHIPDHERLLSHLSKMLRPGGKMFLAFPPWRMPFGGHQQMCRNKLLSKIPYLHLLPLGLYKALLVASGEKERIIRELIELRSTGTSIQRFRKLLRQGNYRILKEDFFLINPNYEIKFRLKARKLPGFLNLRYIRDFLTTTCYYVIDPTS